MTTQTREAAFELRLFAEQLTTMTKAEQPYDAAKAAAAAAAVFCGASFALWAAQGKMLLQKTHGDMPRLTAPQHLSAQPEPGWNLPIANLMPDASRSGHDGFAVHLPLVAARVRMGSLFLYKPEAFSVMEMAGCQIAVPVLALSLLSAQDKNHTKNPEAERKAAVKAAVDSLTYTEMKGLLAVYDALRGGDGLVNCRQIAQDTQLSQGSIIAALRKLQSADILESRSLGMKGTYIGIKEPLLLAALENYKKIL